MKSVDLNCDLGESYGRFKVGHDAEIMPWITSCNIACGFHGGDPLTIKNTIALALAQGVKIGAHPSFPDLQGFGRRKMVLPKEELLANLQYQIGALKTMVEIQGGQLHHVKPHGALYNMAANDPQTAKVIISAIASIDENLLLVGPAENAMVETAKDHGLEYIAECFSDRRYNPDTTLVDRHNEKAMIEDQEEAINQVMGIIIDNKVKTIDGDFKKLIAQTICIHGDQPNALSFAKQIHTALIEAGIRISSIHHD